MSKKQSLGNIHIDYELVNLNKVVYAQEEKDQLLKKGPIPKIGKNEASLLVAICPSYTFDFTNLSLVDQVPPISGKNLVTLKTLAQQNQVILFVGIFELLTPLAFLRGISETADQQKITLEHAKKEVEVKAQEFETKFMTQEKESISLIFSDFSNKEKKSEVVPPYLLTSHVRQNRQFKAVQEQITKFYYEDQPERTHDQVKYRKAIDVCVGMATQRIFKNFYAAQKAKKFYCNVKDEKSDKVYDLPTFLRKLMIEHLLDEMALIIVAGQEYNIDYFVHYISQLGKSKENTEMDRLLAMTRQLFLPEQFSNKLLWQPIRFVERNQKVEEVKFTKPSTSSPVMIPEQKTDLSPLPTGHSGSSGSSGGSSSSAEDKSPLSSSPRKTFFTLSDTVIMSKNSCDVLPVKSIGITPLPVISEVKLDLPQLPLGRSSSAGSSGGSSSEEDKSSPLSSSPPKTFDQISSSEEDNSPLSSQPEFVTLEQHIYDLLYSTAISSDSCDLRRELIDTYKRNNEDEIDHNEPLIKLKRTSYDLLCKMARSPWNQKKRLNVIDVLLKKGDLPENKTSDLSLTRNTSIQADIEIKKTFVQTIPLQTKVASNINAIFHIDQSTPPSESKKMQSLPPSPPQAHQYPRSSSPSQKGYGLYNSYPSGHKWKPKDNPSGTRLRTSSHSNSK